MAEAPEDLQDVATDPKPEVKKQNTIKEQWLSMKKEKTCKKKKNARRPECVSGMSEMELEIANKQLRSEIEKTNALIEEERIALKQQKQLLEFHKNRRNEEQINLQKRRADVVRRFEQARKKNLELDVAMEKLDIEKETLEREIDRLESRQRGRREWKDILFKLAPVEWQEAQRAKASSVDLDTGSDTKEPSPCTVTTSANVTNSGHNTLEHKDDAEVEKPLYFSEPQEVLEAMDSPKDQILFSIENNAKLEVTLKELKQSNEITNKKAKEEEDKVALQIQNVKDKIEKEKSRATKLKHRVLLHKSLDTTEEDTEMEALAVMVSEAYKSCIDKPLTNPSTLEMLAHMENRMSTLQEQVESLPKDFVETVMQMKESERRSRQEQEQLRLKREKQMERRKKCKERSMGNSKKKMGRKLMPRSVPVESTTKKEESQITSEDELEAYMYGPDDI